MFKHSEDVVSRFPEALQNESNGCNTRKRILGTGQHMAPVTQHLQEALKALLTARRFVPTLPGPAAARSQLPEMHIKMPR